MPYAKSEGPDQPVQPRSLPNVMHSQYPKFCKQISKALIKLCAGGQVNLCLVYTYKIRLSVSH